MYQKLNGLAMNSENLAKINIIENKLVSLSSAAKGHGKKGGEKQR
jgi:hypothetical protein